MSEWQTIDSAPKDGTVIDLWHEHFGRLTDVWWDDEDEIWTTAVFDEVDLITHWMPLPQPPLSSDEEAPRADTGSPQERGQPDTEDLSSVMI